MPRVGVFHVVVGVGAEGSQEAKDFWAWAKSAHPEWSEADLQRLWHLDRNMTAAHFWQTHPELDEETKQRLWHARKNKNEGVSISDVVNVAALPFTAPVKAAAAITKSIPIVGDVTRIMNDFQSAPIHAISQIASGANVSETALNFAKDQLKSVKEIAPYAQTIVSVVPGIGTGVAAAIAAGAALAEGKPITEALESAVAGAIPGGAIAQAAFHTAMAAAQGKNLAQAALESTRNLIPDGPARKAFDVGLAVATGKNLQSAVANGLASLAPAQVQSLIASGKQAVGSIPAVASIARSLPAAAQDGVAAAASLLKQAGANNVAASALRGKLTPDQAKGFDAALKAANPTWLTPLVAGAPPMRTPPKPATAAPPMKAPPGPAKAPAAASAAAPATAPRLVAPVTKSVGKPSAAASAPAAAAANAVVPAFPPYPFPPQQQAGLSGCGDSISSKRWGPPFMDISGPMEWAARSAVNGSRGRPRMVEGPDGNTYLFSMENGVLTGRKEVA